MSLAGRMLSWERVVGWVAMDSRRSGLIIGYGLLCPIGVNIIFEVMQNSGSYWKRFLY